MARKIRFPLEMSDGAKVRDIEELKVHFSLESVLEYLANGKLITWLRDRYYEDIVQEILSLDTKDSDYRRKLCTIFGVEYCDEENDYEEYTRKLELLRQYTDNREYDDVVDFIAFSQEDLYDLLDEEDIDTVYLCGTSFSIPLGRENMTYIGINQPTVVIHSRTVVDFEQKNIHFQNVKLNGEETISVPKNQPMSTVCEETVEEENTVTVTDDIQDNTDLQEHCQKHLPYGEYCQSYIGILLPVQDRIASQQLYETLVPQFQDVHYHIDDDIRELRNQIRQSGIIGMAKNFPEILS